MSSAQGWVPRSIECLRGYTVRQFSQDLIAGLTVGLVALPLAMAFAIASGVPPQAGLYTAVVAGFLISALGGSRTQIGGPTGAFVVIVAGIVVKFGVGGLALVGIMAGVMLLFMGFTGLGAAVKYIPRPVTIGFTNGIALLIASTQIKDFFGMKTPPVPSEFLARIRTLIHYAGTTRWQAAAVAASSLVVILLWPRLTKRLPGSIVALLLSTVLVAVFHLPIETIGSKFGGIPQGFPHFAVAQLSSGTHPAVASVSLHRCTACRSRKFALCRRCRWHEWRSPQLERGAGSAGHCQYCLSALWGHSGNRGNCSHSN